MVVVARRVVRMPEVLEAPTGWLPLSVPVPSVPPTLVPALTGMPVVLGEPPIGIPTPVDIVPEVVAPTGELGCPGITVPAPLMEPVGVPVPTVGTCARAVPLQASPSRAAPSMLRVFILIRS